MQLRPSFITISLLFGSFLGSQSVPTNGSESVGGTVAHPGSSEKFTPSNPLPPWKPSEVKSNTASNPHQEASRDNTQDALKNSLWPTIGSWPDWILVIVGLCTVIAAFKTLGIIAVQSKAASASAEAALEEAKAITLSEQAYVFAKVELREEYPPDLYAQDGRTKWIAHALFINHGKTPAIIINMSGDPYFASSAPQEFLPIAHNDRRFPEGWVIATGGTFQRPIEIALTGEQTVALAEKRLHLYCAGFIRYKDILGKERETGYCWEYFPHPQHGFDFCKESKLNYYT